MISDDALEDRLFRSLKTLAQTDESAAEYDVEAETQKYKMQEIADTVFQHSDGNIEERKTASRLSAEYRQARADYLKAVLRSKTLKYQRETEDQVIGSIRSIMANRRQGHVV